MYVNSRFHTVGPNNLYLYSNLNRSQSFNILGSITSPNRRNGTILTLNPFILDARYIVNLQGTEEFGVKLIHKRPVHKVSLPSSIAETCIF